MCVLQETSEVVVPSVPEPTMMSEATAPAIPQVAASTGPLTQQQQEPEVDPHAPSPEPLYAKDGACTGESCLKWSISKSSAASLSECFLFESEMEINLFATGIFSVEKRISSFWFYIYNFG